VHQSNIVTQHHDLMIQKCFQRALELIIVEVRCS